MLGAFECSVSSPSRSGSRARLDGGAPVELYSAATDNGAWYLDQFEDRWEMWRHDPSPGDCTIVSVSSESDAVMTEAVAPVCGLDVRASDFSPYIGLEAGRIAHRDVELVLGLDPGLRPEPPYGGLRFVSPDGTVEHEEWSSTYGPFSFMAPLTRFGGRTIEGFLGSENRGLWFERALHRR